VVALQLDATAATPPKWSLFFGPKTRPLSDRGGAATGRNGGHPAEMGFTFRHESKATFRLWMATRVVYVQPRAQLCHGVRVNTV
jgi:hypothetical protein